VQASRADNNADRYRVDPVLANEAQPYLEEFMERNFKEADPDVYERLRRTIDEIEQMFA